MLDLHPQSMPRLDSRSAFCVVSALTIAAAGGHDSPAFRIKETGMSPNRVVALLTPLVFAPLAGAIAAWLAENFPGVEVSQSQLEGIFITGALIAFGKSAQWLHGWQKWEEREANATLAADQADAAAAAAPAVALAGVEAADGDDFAFEDEAFDTGLEDDDDLLLEDDPLLDEDPLLTPKG
jgi:hypothetical protein